MRASVLPDEERRREMAWRCPRCGRSYRNHVFAHATPAAGPMCNTCCVELEWAEVEAAAPAAETAASKPGAFYPG